MSRVYAVREDDGKRVLVEIRCDGCQAVRPRRADVPDSGWVKHEYMLKGVYQYERNFCPQCQ